MNRAYLDVSVNNNVWNAISTYEQMVLIIMHKISSYVDNGLNYDVYQ